MAKPSFLDEMAAVPAEEPTESTFSAPSGKPASKGENDGTETPKLAPKSTNESPVSTGEKSPAGIADEMVKISQKL